MSQQWTDLQRYVIEEHFEDYVEGRISRREMLRRVTYVTGAVAASLAALSALGCNVDQPRAVSSAAAAASTAPRPASPRPNVAYATPPATATTDPVTVKPDDRRLASAGPVAVPQKDGPLIGYQARPQDVRGGVIVVIHENRGLTEHIKDVVRRVATAGFPTVAVDLLSRQGGADKLGDAYTGAIANQPVDQMVSDLLAALDFLRKDAPGAKRGAVGFCFGGGMVWSMLAAFAPLDAAVPFYGPLPSRIDALATTKAAVLAIYAEQDTRITASWPDAEAQLKKSGSPYAQKVEPGVGHAFHNDTNGPSRYGPAQAQDAWVATIEHCRKYLV